MTGSPVPQQDTAIQSAATILLDGAESLVQVGSEETVLEAARRAGLNPPYSCESGICGTCMARLSEGRVEMRTNEVLSDDDVAEGYILTCQSLPQTPAVTVEYE
ncbi:2Fe-2S iron-sulfur cluster-binding protein [Nocardia sp. NBC_01377]|uniref:2Fe-2S iron-sulfur cluster-binding protein n=1 Tax=Nocardia TaxID=1817 RepID=UPI001C2307DE|nr:2Fe-2S iron-sulfur cluster-binding protein [Nocardia noduli]